MNYFTAPDYSDNRDISTLFLAGPILGAPKWQYRLATDLNHLNINIASPRSDNKDKFNYDDQVEWETYYLNKADYIVFYIPHKEEDITGRDYAQTSRFELGEWLANSIRYRNKKIFVCVDKEIPGINYLKKKVKDQYQCIWCESYDDLIKHVEIAVNFIESSESKLFVTADTHFNAQRTLELSRRPFKSVEHMNDVMINNWNDVVKPKDKVLHLGDFGDFNYRKFLNGRIYLVLGNYEVRDIQDYKYTRDYLLQYFDKVCDDYIINDSEYGEIYCCHEPMKCKEGQYNFFGHIHGRQMIKKFGLDVGVDVHHYTPLSFEEGCKFFLNSLEKGYYDENVWRN